uniref:Uncharacterized protein n=1 Tax=Strongyloides stercoralis TaxID=6248 RepID=A0A0K0E4V9_STRER
MDRLINFFTITLISSEKLENRIEKINNKCWKTSIEYLQNSDTIGNFFANRKLVNYVYSILYELHRDLFPEEMKKIRGSMKAFLITIHNFLLLSKEFTFDSSKLQNIVKQRKKRYDNIDKSKINNGN